VAENRFGARVFLALSYMPPGISAENKQGVLVAKVEAQ
jgi:hypothetical protein